MLIVFKCQFHKSRTSQVGQSSNWKIICKKLSSCFITSHFACIPPPPPAFQVNFYSVSLCPEVHALMQLPKSLPLMLLRALVPRWSPFPLFELKDHLLSLKFMWQARIVAMYAFASESAKLSKQRGGKHMHSGLRLGLEVSNKGLASN